MFNEATRKPPEEPGGIRTARDFVRLGLVSAKTYKSGIMRLRTAPLGDPMTRSPSLAPTILGRGSPEDGPAFLMCGAGAPAQQLFCDTWPASKVVEGMTVGAGQGRRT
jgi:hypothetical protein